MTAVRLAFECLDLLCAAREIVRLMLFVLRAAIRRALRLTTGEDIRR